MNEGKQFYRCVLCQGVVSGWDIEAGDGCPKCASLKMSPSNLSWWEMLVQIIKHPRVWAWPEDQEIATAAFPKSNTKKWTPDGPVDG